MISSYGAFTAGWFLRSKEAALRVLEEGGVGGSGGPRASECRPPAGLLLLPPKEGEGFQQPRGPHGRARESAGLTAEDPLFHATTCADLPS